jgi:hypothetical protein
MPSAFRYLAIQHICPFCGVVMYESGGQITPLGWVAAIILACVVVIGLGAELRRSTDLFHIVGIIGSTLFWGYIIFRIVRRKK